MTYPAPAPPVERTTGETLIGWTLVGLGVLLVYAAYKNRPVLDLISGKASTPKSSPSIGDIYSTVIGGSTSGSSGSSNPTTSGGGNSGVTVTPINVGARPQALKNRTIQPQLVNIPGGGKLDVSAAASLAKVIAQFGAPIPNVGTFRSFAEQAAAYAKDPNRFAPPGQSLHEVGLAIDVADTVAGGVNNPKLINAFASNGWFRRGKEINGTPEPWHWSYGVVG